MKKTHILDEKEMDFYKGLVGEIEDPMVRDTLEKSLRQMVVRRVVEKVEEVKMICNPITGKPIFGGAILPEDRMGIRYLIPTR
jgi:hypothetical protein